MTRSIRRIGLTSTVLTVVLATLGVAWAAQAASTGQGGSFTPTGTYAWVDGPDLGATSTGEQWATAHVAGLTDADHNAGFRLRNGGGGSILVAVSGTRWKIEPGGGSAVSGAFAAGGGEGDLRVAVSATNVVTITWNGATVTTRQVSGTYDGRGVTPTVWQSSATVQMTGITTGGNGSCASESPGAPSPSTSRSPSTGPSPSGSTSPGVQRWISGASGTPASTGAFGSWRGESVGIGGTWDNDPDAQLNPTTVSDGDWTNWNLPIDIALGAIWKSRLNQTWAAAARGDYDSRWNQSLTNLKRNWGNRNQANLYIRFAHEMNGTWFDWNVQRGEEADFRAALTRFSNLRYQILPEAHLVLSANDGTGTGIDVRDLFVDRDGQGRRVVDVYDVDSYNQYPHRTDYQDIRASFEATDDHGAPVGIEAHRRFAQEKGVPFAISEWGNCAVASRCGGGSGESPAYMQAFNDWCREHAGDPDHPVGGQLLYEIYFDIDQFLMYPNGPQPQTAQTYANLVWGR